ncbi:LacI family DNA-binding transcriptional regulator [Humibacter ginsenosidimutans]|uniref:LacI family DNA-binding transcriptional regulator n=1 Tax=Humibacter ginsenosidimutans TaxID=2599293 RepID=UPI001FEEF694|nr:LacI family DNA-binding transcriptional regulator [Humibacter ginsenosidimutans]
MSSALNDRPGVSEETRKRIVATANELGFVPSLRGRSLSGRRAFAVGLVVHRDPDVLELDPFFGGFIGGIEECIDARAYALVLQISASSDGALDRYRRLAADRRVDGVFLNELEVDDPRVGLVEELGLPAVGVNAEAGFPLPAVRQSHDEGIRALVAHLVELGHRRIAYVRGRSEFIHSVRREAAWRDAVTSTGLVPGPVVSGDFTYAGGLSAASALMGLHDRPTAVCCANDLSAMGFIAQAQHMGFDVPGDISVAGFDGIQLGTYVRPSMTTVQTSPRRIGFEAAKMLLSVIDGETEPDVRIPPAELLVRESTGPAPAEI